MASLRARLRWRREMWRMIRESHRAYVEWMRARDEYRNTAVVFRDERGAWGDAGPVGRAQDVAAARLTKYREVQEKMRRLYARGPE